MAEKANKTTKSKMDASEGSSDRSSSQEERASQLHSMWEYASVVAFLDSFASSLKITKAFTPWELEDALLGLPERALPDVHGSNGESADVDENGTADHRGDDGGNGDDAAHHQDADDIDKAQSSKKPRVNGDHSDERSFSNEADDDRNGSKNDSNGGDKVLEEKEDKKDEEEEGDDDDSDKSSEDAEDGRTGRQSVKKEVSDPNYQYLATLHIALLKNVVGRGSSLLTPERWEGYLRRQLDQHWGEDLESTFGATNPLHISEYTHLPLRTKVLLLKFLCDLQLDSNSGLLADIHELESRKELAQLRPTSLGRDGRGRYYWYFGAGKRPYLYREKPPLLEDDRLTIITPAKWKLVCKTLAEMEALADDMIESNNKHTRRLATTIMHEVVPPLFAQELEEQKAIQRKARTRRAGIDTSNVINGLAASRSRRARKVVNYHYDEKQLDKAIREYNREGRSSAANAEDHSDSDGEQQTVKGTRSSSRLAGRQKRKRSDNV